LSYIPTTAIIAYAFLASHHYRYYTEICHGIRSHHQAGGSSPPRLTSPISGFRVPPGY